MKDGKNRWGLPLTLGLMALTLWVFFRDLPSGEVLAALARAKPGWLLLGVGLMFVSVALEAACTWCILNCLSGRPVPYGRCLGYAFAGFYFSAITPSASGGQPAQVWRMARDGIPAAHGALDMLLVTLCYQTVMLGYALTALVCFPGMTDALGQGMGLLLLIGGVLMVGLTAGILALMFAPGPVDWLAGKGLAFAARLGLLKDRARAERSLAEQMDRYRRGAQVLRRAPGLAGTLLGLTFCQITAVYLVPYTVCLAFGIPGQSPARVVAAQALISLAAANVPLPGGLGAAESGFLQSFAAVFGMELVRPAMLVSRGISFYTFLPISGIVTLLACLGHPRTQEGECACQRQTQPEY